jgi:hypothetical protein
MSRDHRTCPFCDAVAGADPFSDLGSLSRDELRATITALNADEVLVSYHRWLLHRRIDRLRAELVNRLRRDLPPEP